MQALLRARAEDVVRTTLYHVGCPLCPSTHGVLNSAIQAAQAHTGDVVGEFAMDGRQVPIARFHGMPPPIQVSGQAEAMALYAGQSVGDVHAIQPAAGIVAELVGGPAERTSSMAARAEMA